MRMKEKIKRPRGEEGHEILERDRATSILLTRTVYDESNVVLYLANFSVKTTLLINATSYFSKDVKADVLERDEDTGALLKRTFFNKDGSILDIVYYDIKTGRALDEV